MQDLIFACSPTCMHQTLISMTASLLPIVASLCTGTHQALMKEAVCQTTGRLALSVPKQRRQMDGNGCIANVLEKYNDQTAPRISKLVQKWARDESDATYGTLLTQVSNRWQSQSRMMKTYLNGCKGNDCCARRASVNVTVGLAGMVEQGSLQE